MTERGGKGPDSAALRYLSGDLSGGRATAAAIPRARMPEIEGIGQDLPRFAWL
jgi:hypothetical protein